MKAIISAPSAVRPSAIEKALFAMTRAQTHPTREERFDKASLVYDDKLVSAIIERGAAPLGTTTGSGWASQLAQSLVGDFIATLAPLSAAAQIISQGLQVNLGRAEEMTMPAREGAPSTNVQWVGEGSPIPVRSYTLNADTILSPRKFGFIVAVSREMAKRANGESVIRTLMREDAATSLDAAYLSTAAGDAVTHAGMLHGVTPLVGYGGGDRDAMETDLTALSDAISAAGSGSVVFVVSPKRAARIRIKWPELNREVTFIPSLAVADTTVIALDPLSWAHGFSDDFDLVASESAVMHMSDDPDPISQSGVADPVRSMFQTACIAMRLLADVAFAPRRPNAVAYVQNVTW